MSQLSKAGASADNRAMLQAVRAAEIEQVLALLPPGAAVLEIGAGSGWQARALAEHGHRVDAVDLARSRYREDRVWPVVDYDGIHIPFSAERFDVVFSSNVLEHVESLEVLMAEMRRVLKPGGFAVHFLPTSSWRIWATASHYVILADRLIRRLKAGRAAGRIVVAGAGGDRPAHRDRPKVQWFPAPHGARGNFITEIYWFSRAHWSHFFRRTGWRVARCFPNRLFYTRALALRPTFSIKRLRSLSRLLGSSCRVYVLEPVRISKERPLGVSQ